MSKAPAFQFYANDFMDATRFWEANAVGLYIRCLCIQWTQGAIPADLKMLARGINCELAELQEVWLQVGQKFELCEDGNLRNSRLEEVRDRQKEISDKRSAAAHASVVARANAKANGTTKAKQRKVKEKIEGEQEGEGMEGVQGEPKRKGPDPGVQGVIDHLTTSLQEKSLAKGLDRDPVQTAGGVRDGNRLAAKTLLTDLQRDYPGFDPLTSAKALIDAALQDPFHRSKCTKVRYLANNYNKLIIEAKERRANTKTQTNDDYQRGILEALARRQAERTAAGQQA